MVDNDCDSITKNLPEDLICTEIFSRLPTKFVGRCRCLSKTCRTRLSSSQFISLHLTRKPQQEHPIFLRGSGLLHMITFSRSTHTASCDEIQSQYEWSSTLGSCNGLVFLKDWLNKMHLLNPITLQHFKVPVSTFTWDQNVLYVRFYGFGYDSSTDDYKAVRLSFAGAFSRDISVEVYSFKSCVWKRLLVDNYPYGCHSSVESLCFVNGAVHWLVENVRSESCVIVAFDLANEIFHEIPTPTVFCRLVTLRGCLSAMKFTLCSKHIEIWMMSEYGVADSWTKFITTTIHTSCVIPSFLNSDDEFVLGNNGNDGYQTSLVLCNMKERTTRNITVGVDGLPLYRFRQGCSFVDSLVWPNEVSDSTTCQCVEERINWLDRCIQ